MEYLQVHHIHTSRVQPHTSGSSSRTHCYLMTNLCNWRGHNFMVTVPQF